MLWSYNSRRLKTNKREYTIADQKTNRLALGRKDKRKTHTEPRTWN